MPVLLLALAACDDRSADRSKVDNATAGDPIVGKKLFSSCANCHQVGPSARGGFGPQLNGIIGRSAGSTDYPYSAAMKTAQFSWTEDKLRAFLHDPDTVVPGNKMRFFGIRDDRDMRDLIAYLRTLQ